jgi:NAD(P)-dependent dehydrogenase (short-subunit alcohol dehydrogenase family)
MSNVIVVIGAGSIGQAVARRVSAGKHVLLADLRQENTDAAAEILRSAGFEASIATIDVSNREAVRALVQTATALGEVTGVIHAAGVSPTQAAHRCLLVRRTRSEMSQPPTQKDIHHGHQSRGTAQPRCAISEP